MSLDTSPRTQRFVPVDVLTSGYRLVGKFAVTTHGSMGVLNDSTHSVVEIYDARMARLHMPTKLVDHFEVVRTLKGKVHAICMARREDLGPHAIVRGGYTNVIEYSLRLATSMFEVVGTMELPGRFDFASLVSEGSREFLPVFNATLTAILIPSLRVESPAILINRRMVDLIALASQRIRSETNP
ncbi:MAG TPA: hypothetical protein PK078_13590 [Anaerolineales bacterium]|nr:hypothetical protein [Anaerolineales bacterium]HNA90472.1 hypothetical protein [Anaerolineales bacterium]HNB37533.1 hypothetical protein [Anaerolineales bacterium]